MAIFLEKEVNFFSERFNFEPENFHLRETYFGASWVYLSGRHYWGMNFDFCRFGLFLQSFFELKFGHIERVLLKWRFLVEFSILFSKSFFGS